MYLVPRQQGSRVFSSMLCFLVHRSHADPSLLDLSLEEFHHILVSTRQESGPTTESIHSSSNEIHRLRRETFRISFQLFIPHTYRTQQLLEVEAIQEHIQKVIARPYYTLTYYHTSRTTMYIQLSSVATLLLMASSTTVSHGFAAVKRAGGRPAILPDRIDTPNQVFEPPRQQFGSSAARLIILQITDVYTLENIASFKTLVEETRANNPDATVVSMLTGDFLSPYLLSSVDRGAGMMNALGKMGLDYITWGNHEADM